MHVDIRFSGIANGPEDESPLSAVEVLNGQGAMADYVDTVSRQSFRSVSSLRLILLSDLSSNPNLNPKSKVVNRGAAVIDALGASSAASAANARRPGSARLDCQMPFERATYGHGPANALRMEVAK